MVESGLYVVLNASRPSVQSTDRLLPAHYGQSLVGNKDMQTALQRLRALTALEVRAIAAEARVDTAETLEIANKLLEESRAMKLSMLVVCVPSLNTTDTAVSSYARSHILEHPRAKPT